MTACGNRKNMNAYGIVCKVKRVICCSQSQDVSSE